MNYADIKQYDVANGLGVRVSVFVSGCTHHCKNCFNPETWDFDYGKPFTQAEIQRILDYLRPSYVAGLSVLGGEPFEKTNQEGLLPLLKQVKENYPEKDIWYIYLTARSWGRCVRGQRRPKRCFPILIFWWTDGFWMRKKI